MEPQKPRGGRVLTTVRLERAVAEALDRAWRDAYAKRGESKQHLVDRLLKRALRRYLEDETETAA